MSSIETILLVIREKFDSQRYGIDLLATYSKKESESNDVVMHFKEFSNVHNSNRSSNATRSNVLYKNV